MQNVSICPGTGVTLTVEKMECVLEKRLNSFSPCLNQFSPIKFL